MQAVFAAGSNLAVAVRRLCSSGRQPIWGGLPLYGALPPLPPRRSAPSAAQTLAPSRAEHADAAIAGTSAEGNNGSVDSTSGTQDGSNLHTVIKAAATSAVAKADARAEHLQLQMEQAGDPVIWRCRAEKISAQRHAADGSSVNIAGTNEEAELPDPSKGLQENEELCIKRAEKIERTQARCAPLVATARAEAEKWREALAILPEADAEVLASWRAELHAAGYAQEVRPSAEPRQPPLRRKYGKEIDCFLSPSGHEVAVGRSAGANERLSFELAFKDGFWFHADCGVAGSHAAILCPATDVYSLDDVEFAAAIAAWHSKARNEALAAVVYCYGGQLSRPRIPKLGQVHIHGRRGQLHVVPTPPPSQERPEGLRD